MLDGSRGARTGKRSTLVLLKVYAFFNLLSLIGMENVQN